MNYEKSSYIASLWSIQESLLQSYRSIFITIESIFIAVSITIQGFQIPDPIFLAPVILIGLYINQVWLEITSRRGLSVNLLQTILRRHENPNCYPDPYAATEPFEQLRKFQDDYQYRLAQMEQSDFICGDSTRSALGSVIPALFFSYWLFSSVYITVNFIPVGHAYIELIHVWFWVSIVALAMYLFGNLAFHMLRKERNPTYNAKFVRAFMSLMLLFPGVVAHVHAVIPGYLG